jgi:ribosomal protein L39E
MARYKKTSTKKRLVKQGKQTRWAPYWVIPKSMGQGKRIHPSRLTRVKRSWRRTKIKGPVKRTKRRNIKSGRKKKKY